MTRTALPSGIAVFSAGKQEGERAQEQLAALSEGLTVPVVATTEPDQSP